MAASGSLGWWPVALCACRIGFDATPVEPDASIDAAVDAAPDAAVPLCDQYPAALYCSDFEGGALAGAARLGGAALAPGAGWNGSDGVRVTAAPGQIPRLQIALPSAITSGELHIGARMFLAAGPPSTDFVVITQTLSPTFEKISFDLNGFDRVQLVNAIGSGGLQGSNDSFPRGRWACMELSMTVAEAGAGGRVALELDGFSVLSGFAGTDTVPAAGFTRVELGAMASAGNTVTETITFDNWIISTTPIGCP